MLLATSSNYFVFVSFELMIRFQIMAGCSSVTKKYEVQVSCCGLGVNMNLTHPTTSLYLTLFPWDDTNVPYSMQSTSITVGIRTRGEYVLRTMYVRSTYFIFCSRVNTIVLPTGNS